MEDMVGVKSCSNPTEGHNGLQHDLEKLQEAHDKLMHQLEGKSNLLEKVHLELDKAFEERDGLKALLEERESDLAKADRLVKEGEEKAKDNEVTLTKMKQLALKLKKELAEAKAQKQPPTGNKEQTKQLAKENERITNEYQQLFRNFQNLQADYDKVQDDLEQVKGTLKSKEADLTSSISELTKIREEFAENKHENDNLKKKMASLESDLEENRLKRKELESKLIVFETELQEERKKVVNQTGLEKTLIEYRNQIEAKAQELIEVEEQLFQSKQKERDSELVFERLQETSDKLLLAEEDVRDLLYEKKQLIQRLETINSSYEHDKVRSAELVSENQRLEEAFNSLKETLLKKQKEFEYKVRDLKEQLAVAEEDVKRREEEFEGYKARVCKVLNAKKNTESETKNAKEMEEALESVKTELESVRKELEHQVNIKNQIQEQVMSLLSTSKVLEAKVESIESTRKENDSLKSLSRDLQCKLVSVRNKLEHQLSELEARHKAREEELQQSFSLLQAENKKLSATSLNNNHIRERNRRHSRDIRSVSPAVSSSSTTVKGGDEEFSADTEVNCNHSSSTPDEMESLETTSLPSRTKRLSVSSGSGIAGSTTNVLDEILNPMNFSLMDESREGEKHWAELSKSRESHLERMADLLEESESSNGLLMEQNRVLKDEIRRLQRSIDRIEMAENLEYLKNIVVKFMSLEGGSSERLQLVPVMKTILKLNPQEESLLSMAASNHPVADGSFSPSSSASSSNPLGSNTWATYLWG